MNGTVGQGDQNAGFGGAGAPAGGIVIGGPGQNGAGQTGFGGTGGSFQGGAPTAQPGAAATPGAPGGGYNAAKVRRARRQGVVQAAVAGRL